MTLERTPSRGPWRLGIVFFLIAPAAAVPSAGAPASAQQGLVHVSFPVEAPFFDALSDAARRDVEERFAGMVVTFGQREYGFLEWRIDGGRTPRLDVHLVEDPLASPPDICPPKLQLVLLGQLSSGNERPLDGEARELALYEACSLVSASDTAALRRRVHVVLDSAFQSSGFKRRLEEGLLNLIPFADRVEPHAADEHVVLPIPCRRIFLGENSRLVVRFVDRHPETGAARDDGRLLLRDPIARDFGRAFGLRPVESGGLIRLAEAARDGRLMRLRVFMQEYHRSLDCERILDDPEET